MPRSFFLFFLPALLALSGFAGTTTGAVLTPALNRTMATAATGNKIPVIVTMADQVDPGNFRGLPRGRQRNNAILHALRQRSETTQSDLRLFLKAAGTGTIKKLWTINGLAFKASPGLIKKLAARADLAEISLDGTIAVPTPVPAAVGTVEANISTVGADLLWDLGLTGSGVVVASIDSGVDYLHPDLSGSYRGGVGAWFDPNNEHATPYDHAGHGTAVMGVLVGGSAGGTAIGVAPGASWIAAKIFDDVGSASYSAIHQAFAWALDPDGDGDTGDAPQVVNNSWVLDLANQCLPEFQPDLNLLRDAGISVLFSGGNSGPNPATNSSPANYPGILAIGAVDGNSTIASFSARGPSVCSSADQLFPRLVAPGVGILTADLSLGGVNPDPYFIASGTSFSAPHVSGLIALLQGGGGFAATPVTELKAALEKGADDLGPPGPDNIFGYGLVNGLATYRRLQGQPHLAVHDPRAPENDRRLDFGSLPVATEISRTLTPRNSGAGFLTFANHDWTTLNASFSVTSDLCSGQSLASDQTCQITVSFTPPAATIYSGVLDLTTNDPDYGLTTVYLSGSGNNNPTPPTLQIDPPGTTLEFGAVPPGSISQQSATLSNSGVEILDLYNIDFSTLVAPFALVSDNCSATSLAQNETCALIFSFAPSQLQAYQAVVEINSNDPQNSPSTLVLSGNGNHPPIAARLVSPADGATDLPDNLTLRWLPARDPDGDQITEQVVLSPAAPQATGRMNMAPMAWISLLLMTIPALLLSRSRLPVPLVLTLIVTLLLLSACGGGGGAAPASITYDTYTVAGLSSNTTYTWKVVSTDSRGAVTESSTWHFTTR